MNNNTFIERIHLAVQNAKTLNEVKQRFIPVLEKEATEKPVGYVAGIMTSDGQQYTQKNIQVLKQRTQIIREQNADKHIFCAPEVFEPIYNFLKQHGTSEEDYRSFWDEVIHPARIQKIYLTPRWQNSIGCQHEYLAALRENIEMEEIYD